MQTLWRPICALLAMAGSAQAHDGYYQADQAISGELPYNNLCAECRRPDLTGAMGPALKGDGFRARWGGKTVNDLYAYEHATMPAVNPGSVTPDLLWPVTAFILMRNGLPAGDAPLDSVTAAKVLPK